MSASSDAGYAVVLQLTDEIVLCVDGARVIRGEYRNAERHYFSPYEVWCDATGMGTLHGSIVDGGTVSAHGLDGRVLCAIDGTPLWNVRVYRAVPVSIGEMLARPCIVGIGEPPRRPGPCPANDGQP